MILLALIFLAVALIFLAVVAFVIAAVAAVAGVILAAVAGVILNMVRAARGKARPLPKRAYWDPSHPRYREAHTVYLPTEPSAQG